MAKIINGDYNLELEYPAFDNMNDEEFFDFCAQNKNIRIERDEDKQILIMAPAGNDSSAMNAKVAIELGVWNYKTKLGIVFDSSAGFYLPDTSMRNPDAAWVSNERWNKIEKEEKKKFSHLAPDFIVELMSPSGRLKPAKNKMEKWIQNGVLLAWLIDTAKDMVYIYKADGTIEQANGFDKKLSGEEVLPGFEFDLFILK